MKRPFMTIVRETIENLYPSCLKNIHIGEYDSIQRCVVIKFDYWFGRMVIFENGSCMTPEQSLKAEEWMILARGLEEIANNYEPKKGGKQ